MRAFLAGAAGALRDNAAKAAGAAAFAAVSGFSALTAANFWYLFGADPLATAALCGSFAALGFAAGFALCWLAQRYGRVGRMRRLLLRLPANQRAACWDAYRREGAFPDREHAADLEPERRYPGAASSRGSWRRPSRSATVSGTRGRASAPSSARPGISESSASRRGASWPC